MISSAVVTPTPMFMVSAPVPVPILKVLVKLLAAPILIVVADVLPILIEVAALFPIPKVPEAAVSRP